MAEHATLPPRSDVAGADPGDGSDADLQSIRSILMGPAERELQRLQARMDDRFAHAREVSAVLPQALHGCSSDPELARALAPPVEQAITASVRRNPQPLAEAIFPIIGPAIRRAVAASLAAMVESFNRTLEHSVSWRALSWRWEALRTGRSFGEVVLLHTLLYRVEQVFLIHRETGLLLQHVRAGPAQVEDAQLVSAMLTAILDFVRDSFHVPTQDSLDALQVGELSVWVEQGPSAILAIVTRGTAPRELRTVLQRAVETIHLRFGEALDAFTGDARSFEASRPVLEELLQAEYRTERGHRAYGAWIVAALVLLALGTWVALSVRDRARWAGYLETLRNEPGLVVISSGVAGGRYVVTGLRDPLARDPDDLLSGTRLPPGEVVGRWEPYHALTPAFVLARARQVLQPPAGTTLRLENGVLSADGVAPAGWIVQAQRLAPLIGGISRFDAGGLVASSLQGAIGGVEATTLVFARGSSRLQPGQEERLRALAAGILELEALAAAAGHGLRLALVGHTDADGPVASNLPLSRLRADHALAALRLPPTPHLTIVTTGVGSDQPLVTGDGEEDKRQNRRVNVRVTRPPAGTPGAR